MTKIIENPPSGWVRNLTPDCIVWLTKQQCTATVVAPYEPPVGAYLTGRMFIKIGDRIDYWFVSKDGQGIDGSLLMQPIEGSLPDVPAKLQSSEAEELRLEIEKLREQIRRLNKKLMFFDIIT